MAKKRIVVCLDGTWNAPEINDPRANRPTNVLKLCRAIEPSDEAGLNQIVFYDSGVGTFGPIDRWVGGATGWGLSGKVQSAYQFVANNYARGDDLYLFGFSRGAFAVRSLAGFIHMFGIIRKTEMHRFPDAYAEYRKPPAKRSGQRFGERFGAMIDPELKHVPVLLLGVWDTVGALGAPTPLLGRLTRRWVSFHNTALPANVRYGYQALALHELRRHFTPVLWTVKEPHQTVEQVWFPGAHSDVGGGYPTQGLSNLALNWMADRARRTGLKLNDPYLSQLGPGDVTEPVTVSRTWKYRLTSRYVRPIGPAQLDLSKQISLDEYRSPAVDDRLARTNSAQRSGDRAFLRIDDLSKDLPELPDVVQRREDAARAAQEEMNAILRRLAPGVPEAANSIRVTADGLTFLDENGRAIFSVDRKPEGT